MTQSPGVASGVLKLADALLPELIAARSGISEPEVERHRLAGLRGRIDAVGLAWG